MTPYFITLPDYHRPHDVDHSPRSSRRSSSSGRSYDLLCWCRLAVFFLILLETGTACVQGDGPADNQVDKVRSVPPPGIAIPEDRRAELAAGLQDLDRKIESLRDMKNSLVNVLLPDVEIFQRALSIALHEDGFFDLVDVDRAQAVLKEGLSRADALASQEAPWCKSFADQFATVRGFRSKIDGTVQPYGVVMNTFPAEGLRRADVWCRGRSEKGLEMQFLAARLTQNEPMPEPGCIMIHPFGRYCNANKLAGEIDTLEAIEHAKRAYGIDPNRIAIRGFSMGGAAAWHLAVHYPDRWFAANPGAGFSETPEFLKVFQSETLKPYWFEQKLWQMYDCPVWVRNLRMLPTIAYSGALDKQKQAADIMARAAWELPEQERFELTHIIAPNTAHTVAPDARKEIEKRLKAIDRSRLDKGPDLFTFTTCTLRYNRAHQLRIEALKEHWLPTTVTVHRSGNQIGVYADEGLQQFSLEYDIGEFDREETWVTVTVYPRVGTPVQAQPVVIQPLSVAFRSDRSFGATIRKNQGRWELVSPLDIESEALALRKRHGLQGPIDDAFLEPFLFVRPSGDGLHPETQQWALSEFDRAVREWHRQMRGDAQIKEAKDVTSEDMQRYHLVLWGDPQSNPLLAQLLPKLPLQWNAERLTVGSKSWSSKSHMPVMIYPNPLAPNRYIVLNSSFTYREYDYLNNARQVPKLPDWAVIDLSEPPGTRWPGRIADADFFDEQWQVKVNGPNSSR
jgi:hypothetical protein